MTVSVRKSILEALRPLARIITAGSARVLMYHRFGPAGSHRRMPVDVFERQIHYLCERYNVIALRDLIEKLTRGERLPSRCVAITIDDGYGDFREYAYPVLEKYRVPATVYLVSAFVDQTLWLWFDAIHYITSHAASGTYDLLLADRSCRVRMDDSATRNMLWETVADIGVGLAPPERSDLIASLSKQLSVQLPVIPSPEYRAMTWDAVRSMDEELIEWGGHTFSHPILARCTPEEQFNEISQCKLRIEEMIQRPVESFCYPNGQVGDYDQHTIAAVKRAGFRNAVVAHGGMIESCFDRYLIERLGAPESEIDFKKCVDGVWETRHRARAGLAQFTGRSMPSGAGAGGQQRY